MTKVPQTDDQVPRAENTSSRVLSLDTIRQVPKHHFLEVRACCMGRFLAVVMLGSVAMVQWSFAQAKSGETASTRSVSTADHIAGAHHALPPPPSGKSTVIGGAIRDVDPVRDQFTLKVFGGHSMKILYDARTQVFRDGKKIPLRDLQSQNHASIETVLDGTNVFALSIHILSQTPEGECQGQVVSYNPGTRELAVNAALSNEPIELLVPADTPIVRSDGSSSASDLVRGALITAQFVAGTKGQGIARKITILATPGSTFVFTGNISFLDFHARRLVVVDPRDGNSYPISFDPARFPNSHDLHPGTHVKVTVSFDGERYVASAISIG